MEKVVGLETKISFPSREGSFVKIYDSSDPNI
jgi:hypothetical protein